MDYEKAYKKAVEKLRYKISDNDGNIDYNEVVNVDELQDIFPELAESEEERIRKALIAFIKKRDRSGCDYDYDKWIAWLESLEKQGRQRQETNYPKFDFDDVLALQCCMETVKKVQEDECLYKQLQKLHGRLYDAYQLEKQGKAKER